MLLVPFTLLFMQGKLTLLFPSFYIMHSVLVVGKLLDFIDFYLNNKVEIK
jgi:hypothetical protein